MCFTISFREGKYLIFTYIILNIFHVQHRFKLALFFVVCFPAVDRWSMNPSLQPGGELAIITFAGKDATEEFNMLLKPAKCRSILPPPKNEFCKNSNIRMTWTNEILENRNTLPPLMWHSDSRNSAFKVCHN